MARGAGRFAPSPTGPLHLGSLLAATASFLDARSQGVPWRLRIDDLDTPRNQPGAEDAILRALEAHGLFWDGPVTRQSESLETYQAALAKLASQQLLFYCDCSRRRLARETAYPGTCRRYREPRSDCAIRVRVNESTVAFDDLVRGHTEENLASTVGDFVVRRRDGIIAYQLATAVDDGSPAIGRVIRGNDLLANTGRQIFLMEKLGLDRPVYGHVPVLVNSKGQKLSKQTHAAPLALRAAPGNLRRVLGCLGFPAAELPAEERCEDLMAWATKAWSLTFLPRRQAIEIS